MLFDYVIYLLESNYNIGIKKDPLTFLYAIKCNNSENNTIQ